MRSASVYMVAVLIELMCYGSIIYRYGTHHCRQEILETIVLRNNSTILLFFSMLAFPMPPISFPEKNEQIE